MKLDLTWKKNRVRQKGFTLVAAAVCVVALFGAAGLAIDIGRMYITKNEAQGYADAAAVSAAIQLDGSAAGLTAADAAVANSINPSATLSASANRWNFGTTVFSAPVTEYSADGLTGWATSGTAVAANMRYARVSATVGNLPLLLLPVLGAAGSPIGVSTTVKASAVAGQVIRSPTVFPFSPVAHAINCPGTGFPTLGTGCDSTNNFGFQIGQQYDLKWPQSPAVGSGSKAPCDGDNLQSWVNEVVSGPPELGGVAFSGTSGFMTQIADDTRPYSPELRVGDYLNPTNGDKNAIVDAFNDRAAADASTNVVYQTGVTDINNNTSYATYKSAANHTGRRIITVIVRTGYSDINGVALTTAQQSIGVGFAQFLLLPHYDKSGGSNNAWCATYLGNDVLYGTGKTGVGTDGQGVAYVRLTQ